MRTEETIILLCGLCILFLTSIAFAQEDAVYFQSSPPYQEITKGEEFSVDIIVSPTVEIHGVSVDKISWDEQLAELQEDPIHGDLFDEDLFFFTGKPKQDEPGAVYSMAWAANNGTESQGVLATLQFIAIESGNFSIYFDVNDTDAMNTTDHFTTIVSDMGTSGPIQEPRSDDGEEDTTGYLLYIVAIGAVSGSIVVGVLFFFKRKHKDNTKRKEKEEEQVEKIQKKTVHSTQKSTTDENGETRIKFTRRT